MRKILSNVKKSDLILYAVLLVCALIGIVDAFSTEIIGVLAAAGTAVVPRPDNEFGSAALGGDGTVGSDPDGIQTLQQALNDSPNLVSRKIHEEVIKIAPYDYTMRSLLSKNFKQRKKTGDHKIAVYSSNSEPIQATVAATGNLSGEQVRIDFGADGKLFSVNQTVFFPTFVGYMSDGTTQDNRTKLVGYVVNIDSGQPVIKSLNGPVIGGTRTIPVAAQAAGTPVLRGLRTGTETQIRTDPVNILPTDREYYIQKNIIEFQVSGWFDNATKEVKWDDRDRMEMAIAEKTRTSMPDFWFGVGGQHYISTTHNKGRTELAFFSEGVWNQAGREFNFGGSPDVDSLIEFASFIFTGNRSSNTKYFVMGSRLAAELQKVIFNNPVMLGETYRDKQLNINFTEVSFFGGKRILFADDPSLDDVGMPHAGFCFDDKYAWEEHYGMMSVPLDGVALAESDTQGQAIVEENCFILANHEAHCRVLLG